MVKILLKLQKKGCNLWNKLIKNYRKDTTNIQKRQRICTEKFNLQEGDIFWNKVYQLNMSLNFNNHYRFFHLQISKYNLFTKKHSVHFRDQDNLCTFCNLHPEEMVHLLYHCTKVQTLMNEIKTKTASKYAKVRHLDNFRP